MVLRGAVGIWYKSQSPELHALQHEWMQQSVRRTIGKDGGGRMRSCVGKKTVARKYGKDTPVLSQLRRLLQHFAQAFWFEQSV